MANKILVEFVSPLYFYWSPKASALAGYTPQSIEEVKHRKPPNIRLLPFLQLQCIHVAVQAKLHLRKTALFLALRLTWNQEKCT